jgi:hypothetical protein
MGPVRVRRHTTKSWLALGFAEGLLSGKMTDLDRAVVSFSSSSFYFVIMFALVLGAIPLFVIPALSAEFGWSFGSSSLYTPSVLILVLACSALAVWSLWRKHRDTLASHPAAENHAAQQSDELGR